MGRAGAENPGLSRRVAILLAIAGLVLPCLPARGEDGPDAPARLAGGSGPEDRPAPLSTEDEVPAPASDNASDETEAPDLDELLSWSAAVSGRREVKPGRHDLAARAADPFPPIASSRPAVASRHLSARVVDLPTSLCRLIC